MEYKQAETIHGSYSNIPIIDAIITARGGSKGIPKKNIRLLQGKPLIVYTIEAALNCSSIRRCFVSTEDEEIKHISKLWGAEVIDRPAELATDLTLSNDVIKHALLYLKETSSLPEYFVLLQPTSPLRTSMHIKECIEMFFKSDAKSAISVTDVEHHPYKSFLIKNGKLVPLFNKNLTEVPRQLLPKVFKPNGAIYLLGTKTFLDYQRFFVEPVMPYWMSPEDSIDIDTELDFLNASLILENRKQKDRN